MALKLMGEVSLDGSGFEKGLGRLGGSVKGFVATAFGIYGVEQAIRKTFETADELVNASQRLGIGVEKLQLYKQAAKDAGSSLELMVSGFEKIALARSKALGTGPASGKALAAFGQMGVGLEQLQSNSPETLFTDFLSQAVRKMNPADLAAPMREIFGKGFGPMVGILQTDFDGLESSMKKIGAIMDTETAAALDLLGDQFSMVASILAVQLGPKLLTFAEVLYKIGAGFAATWAWLSSRFNSGAPGMQAVMANTPGFGGYAPGGAASAKKAIADAQPTSEDKEKAKQAGIDTLNKWLAPLEELKKKFAEAADKLKHPVKAHDYSSSDAAAPKVKLAKDHGGDALTRVGNFLGSSRDVLADIANRQVILLQRIATNTTPKTSADGSGVDWPDDL